MIKIPFIKEGGKVYIIKKAKSEETVREILEKDISFIHPIHICTNTVLISIVVQW